MDDNRVTQRQKVIKAGTISFDGSGIDCLVRNMSIDGANLEVESQIGIPGSFELNQALDSAARCFSPLGPLGIIFFLFLRSQILRF
jgi:hypothetical protein